MLSMAFFGWWSFARVADYLLPGRGISHVMWGLQFFRSVGEYRTGMCCPAAFLNHPFIPHHHLDHHHRRQQSQALARL